MLSAPSNLTLVKWRDAYWCYFSVLVLLLATPRNFSVYVIAVVLLKKNC